MKRVIFLLPLILAGCMPPPKIPAATNTNIIMRTAMKPIGPQSATSKVEWAALLYAQKSARWHNVFYHVSDRFIISARNAKTNRLIWTKPYIPTKSFYGSPITVTPIELFLQIHHDVLYINDSYGMMALQSGTGRQIWKTIYPNDAFGKPSIQEGVIITAYESSGAISTGAAEAFEARTGHFLWRVVGVRGFGFSEPRKGFLLFHCDSFMGSGPREHQTVLVNIHTGR